MSEVITQGQEPGASEIVQPNALAPADPSATPPAAVDEGAKQDTQDAAEQPRDDKGRFAKRAEQLQGQISALTAEKHAAKRELETLQRQAAALRQQFQAAQQVDPNDIEATEMSRTQRAVIGVQHGLAQEQAKAAANRMAEVRVATFNAKLDAARERIPDIDQNLAVFSRLPVSDHVADLIVESERTAEITNYLARNPQEAIRIYSLPPAYQGAEIARIEARVSALPVKRISQAPQPVQTVSGGAGNPGVDLSSLSMADYIKARESGAGR